MNGGASRMRDLLLTSILPQGEASMQPIVRFRRNPISSEEEQDANHERQQVMEKGIRVTGEA